MFISEDGEISTCAGLSNATADVIKACEDGDVDRVKLLTSIYSELTKCPGKQQMTPIMAAALAGQGKVWLILAKRLDLNRVDQYQRSILHLACIGGNANIVRGVIVRERKKTHRLNLEKKAYHGITPLITAAGNGHLNIVKLLLKRGAQISNTDTRKNTALDWASIRGHLNIVEYLIQMKSDPDRGSQDGTTPLMYSIQHNREQVFQRLVEKSDLTKVDYAGNNPLHIAAFFGRTKMTSALLQKNIPIASLCYLGRNAAMKAAYSGEIPTLAILIKQNADINLRDINGNTILHIACMKNHPFMVKYLLKRLKITNFLRLNNNDNRSPEELALHYKNDRVYSYIQSFKQSKSTKKP